MRTATSSFVKHMEENTNMLNSVKDKILQFCLLNCFPLSVSSASNEIKCKLKNMSEF